MVSCVHICTVLKFVQVPKYQTYVQIEQIKSYILNHHLNMFKSNGALLSSFRGGRLKGCSTRLCSSFFSVLSIDPIWAPDLCKK